MIDKTYPRILERVIAVFVDSIVIVLLMFVISQLFSYFETVPEFLRITAFLFVFVFYDPICTSSFGGTIGHMTNKIRVKREKDETKNIVFPLALIRFIVKVSLGWLSLLTVGSNKKSKAVHDMVAGSVVIYFEK